MQEMKQQKLAFFKKEKEDSNTDFSLVKGALTENINRLEKMVNGDASKYIQEKNLKENA
ncbi:stage III sporulation protein AA [Bacillus pseudomycoides]|uniref:stage II sporulation protein SB n=1 Tax=Bacillus pseudomycoides TaxID=64104 RepID=UPI000BEB81CB|nr:stage II sporulation protein SB [Bacillus pseudomycoides]PDY02310.1 stage III sporulation protein AA [Bacillus pseudomycoides]PEK78815.1 stage III sporulation protein AA [Bacillus pseudomycoides]PEN07197.1 stage III sporulation protein AA [Bacillus pseudomycoides]PGB79415.1 stage III sporulation protein AA [Bacillus pseudomycoides]PHE52933.1 stage III sporulation protein AA [Bacillus pseudomycoides]